MVEEFKAEGDDKKVQALTTDALKKDDATNEALPRPVMPDKEQSARSRKSSAPRRSSK